VTINSTYDVLVLYEKLNRLITHIQYEQTGILAVVQLNNSTPV